MITISEVRIELLLQSINPNRAKDNDMKEIIDEGQQEKLTKVEFIATLIFALIICSLPFVFALILILND